jgi:Uma2 family endonuclease
MSAQPREPMTQAEFLIWELAQEEKHEYVDGYVQRLFGDPSIQGFAGGTVRHNQIAVALTLLIAPAAAPCRTFTSDMRIETASSTRYADIAVSCDERDSDAGAHVIRHPKLIVEVLSESTARDDLGRKMRDYQTIEELDEYLAVDSRKRWFQIARKRGTQWDLADGSVGVVELQSIGLSLDLDRIYESVGLG